MVASFSNFYVRWLGRVITGKLPVRRVITGKLPVKRVITGKLPDS